MPSATQQQTQFPEVEQATNVGNARTSASVIKSYIQCIYVMYLKYDISYIYDVRYDIIFLLYI